MFLANTEVSQLTTEKRMEFYKLLLFLSMLCLSKYQRTIITRNNIGIYGCVFFTVAKILIIEFLYSYYGLCGYMDLFEKWLPFNYSFKCI